MPGGTTLSLTAGGQVPSRHSYALNHAAVIRCCGQRFSACQHTCVAHQVIIALAESDHQPMPSGRGVATHGAPLSGGDIEAKIKDSSPTWRSILSGGEVAQAYK